MTRCCWPSHFSFLSSEVCNLSIIHLYFPHFSALTAGADRGVSVTSQNLAPLPGTLMTPAKCEPNITAQTGLTASMFCCLGTNNKDLGVGTVPFLIGPQFLKKRKQFFHPITENNFGNFWLSIFCSGLETGNIDETFIESIIMKYASDCSSPQSSVHTQCSTSTLIPNQTNCDSDYSCWCCKPLIGVGCTAITAKLPMPILVASLSFNLI